MERHVHQTSVLKDKRSSQTEPARIAQTSVEPLPTAECALSSHVPLDKSSKRMEDVLTATHTPEQMLMERFVSHITAQTCKSLAHSELVSNAPNSRELKELVLLVDQIPVTLDREFWKMVHANIAHSTDQSIATEELAVNLLASQTLSTSPRMVSANNAHSINKLDQMAPHVSPTQQRSSQIPKLSHQLQSLFKPQMLHKSQHAPLQLVVVISGPTSNSYLRTRLLASTSTNRQAV
jgi:hypothetical protein